MLSQDSTLENLLSTTDDDTIWDRHRNLLRYKITLFFDLNPSEIFPWSVFLLIFFPWSVIFWRKSIDLVRLTIAKKVNIYTMIWNECYHWWLLLVYFTCCVVWYFRLLFVSYYFNWLVGLTLLLGELWYRVTTSLYLKPFKIIILICIMC